MSDKLDGLPPAPEKDDPIGALMRRATMRNFWTVGRANHFEPCHPDTVPFLLDEEEVKRRSMAGGKKSKVFPAPAYEQHGLRLGAPSLRAYRTLADNLLARATLGEISWAEAKAGIAALQTAASMYLGEKMMRANGLEDKAHAHELGPFGGLRDQDTVVVPGVRRRTVTKSGIDGHGNPVRSTETVEEDTMPAALPGEAVEVPALPVVPGLEGEFDP